MANLLELIAQYGVQCSETKELAPSVELVKEIKLAESRERRLRAILPVFQEARDALCVIPLSLAKRNNLRLDLADRMDDVGIPARWKMLDNKEQETKHG